MPLLVPTTSIRRCVVPAVGPPRWAVGGAEVLGEEAITILRRAAARNALTSAVWLAEQHLPAFFRCHCGAGADIGSSSSSSSSSVVIGDGTAASQPHVSLRADEHTGVRLLRSERLKKSAVAAGVRVPLTLPDSIAYGEKNAAPADCLTPLDALPKPQRKQLLRDFPPPNISASATSAPTPAFVLTDKPDGTPTWTPLAGYELLVASMMPFFQHKAPRVGQPTGVTHWPKSLLFLDGDHAAQRSGGYTVFPSHVRVFNVQQLPKLSQTLAADPDLSHTIFTHAPRLSALNFSGYSQLHSAPPTHLSVEHHPELMTSLVYARDLHRCTSMQWIMPFEWPTLRATASSDLFGLRRPTEPRTPTSPTADGGLPAHPTSRAELHDWMEVVPLAHLPPALLAVFAPIPRWMAEAVLDSNRPAGVSFVRFHKRFGAQTKTPPALPSPQSLTAATDAAIRKALRKALRPPHEVLPSAVHGTPQVSSVARGDDALVDAVVSAIATNRIFVPLDQIRSLVERAGGGGGGEKGSLFAHAASAAQLFLEAVASGAVPRQEVQVTTRVQLVNTDLIARMADDEEEHQPEEEEGIPRAAAAPHAVPTGLAETGTEDAPMGESVAGNEEVIIPAVGPDPPSLPRCASTSSTDAHDPQALGKEENDEQEGHPVLQDATVRDNVCSVTQPPASSMIEYVDFAFEDTPSPTSFERGLPASDNSVEEVVISEPHTVTSAAANRVDGLQKPPATAPQAPALADACEDLAGLEEPTFD